MSDLDLQPEFTPVMQEAVTQVDIPFVVDENTPIVDVIPYVDPEDILNRDSHVMRTIGYTAFGSLTSTGIALFAGIAVENWHKDKLTSVAASILSAVEVLGTLLAAAQATKNLHEASIINKRIKSSFDPDTYWLR